MRISVPDFNRGSTIDGCGNQVVAILSSGTISISLCESCLDELRKSLKEYDNTIFCHKCKHSGVSQSGWNYGGSCLLTAPVDLPRSAYGHVFCIDMFDTCGNAERKSL